MDVEANIEAEDTAAEQAGAGAPRVTYDRIKSRIAAQYFFTAGEASNALSQPVHPSLNLLTICILVLDNGFTVTGESACASPENFNAEFGRQLARKAAIDKMWAFEGYLLCEQRGVEVPDSSTWELDGEPDPG